MNKELTIEQLYDKFLITSGVNTDTRTIEPDQFFIALKGDNFNGNEFADQALMQGALFAVVDEEQYATSDQHLLVSDSLKTLQDLATYHRKQLDIPIICITGSNGKTTTKELIAAVLNTSFNCFATKGNLNNHIGVPLSILSITPNHEIAVIELGANHVGEIKDLCAIAQPSFGLITNIGIAHIEGFGSPENVAKAKSELYDYLRTTESRTVFVNSDDAQLLHLSEGLNQIEYGSEGDFISGEILPNKQYLKLLIDDHEQDFTITTHLVGEYNFPNCLAAAAVGRYFQVDLLDVVEAIEQYKPQNNRSQVLKKENTTYIIDAYNANPSSMMAALTSFSKRPEQNKLAILGSMLELGPISDQEHLKIANFLKENQIDAILVGKEFKQAAQATEIDWVENVDEAKKRLANLNLEGKTILLKGSRGIRLEKVLEFI